MPLLAIPTRAGLEVIRCVLQGVLVALLMSALEPVSLSGLDMLSGR